MTGTSSTLEQIPPKLKTLAGRVIRKSGHRFSVHIGLARILSAKRFRFAGMRAKDKRQSGFE
jgi:hypothetical protein